MSILEELSLGEKYEFSSFAVYHKHMSLLPLSPEDAVFVRYDDKKVTLVQILQPVPLYSF